MPSILPLFLFPVLYAESHYAWRGVSLIYRAWPEILSDAPYRVEPGNPVPILFLVKDAHRFPVILDPPCIDISYSDGKREQITPFKKSILVDTPLWTFITKVQRSDSFTGSLSIRITFLVHRTVGKRSRSFVTDNYSQASHAPLHVTIASKPFPRFTGWRLGDLHVHSDFTSDQVEFGAPTDIIAQMGRATGLDFAAVTDHSYDLDDRIDNCLKNDPELTKWKRLHQEIDSFNDDEFCLIPGEEVSCGNRFGQNVHLLLLNNRTFFSGSGDSAESWFRTKPEHRIPEILDAMASQSLAFAAHPEVPFPPLQWVFLRRWKWTRKDFIHSRLNGLQILNGTDDYFFRRGLKNWTHSLLQGHRLSIAAGNDSHGNFNRSRQLGFPFLSIRENNDHVFGKARTGVFIKDKVTRPGILEALRAGKSYITTGPALTIKAVNQSGDQAGHGERLTGNVFKIHLRGLSSEEFGTFQSVKIWLGTVGDRKESLLVEMSRFPARFSCEHMTTGFHVPGRAYVRGEARTVNGAICFTNPIWFNPVD